MNVDITQSQAFALISRELRNLAEFSDKLAADWHPGYPPENLRRADSYCRLVKLLDLMQQQIDDWYAERHPDGED